MLASFLWILLGGFFLGQIARRCKAPPLVGMILAGILLGPQVMDAIALQTLAAADSLRTIAVMVILMKAGLGLDREKLAQQGTVALRLGVLPGAFEAIAIAIASIWLLDFDFPTGLLLGCIVGAESPAVIVPGMLRLKRLGWGVEKGIPDAILTGSALSDVLLLLVFSLLLAFLTQQMADFSLPGGLMLSPLQLLPFQIVLQVALGLAIGWTTARLLVALLSERRWTQNSVQDTLIAAGFALLLVVIAEYVPIFSGYLAVMAAGFFLIAFDAPLARELRGGFNTLWIVAEIVLFVLLGASIQLQVLEDSFFVGMLLLAIGTLVGRSLGWYLSTLGSNWTVKEKLFLLSGNSAKATVQAAIGAVPLAQGISGGETILAISALSILVTAPLGAWAIPTFAPRLLERGEVDPAKVAIALKPTVLAAVDRSSTATSVLAKAAEIARANDGEVVVVHVASDSSSDVEPEEVRRILADIRHRYIVVEGDASKEILRASRDFEATELVVGKRSNDSNRTVGLTSRSVLEQSYLPVVVVEGG